MTCVLNIVLLCVPGRRDNYSLTFCTMPFLNFRPDVQQIFCFDKTMSSASNMEIVTEGFYFVDNGINFIDHLKKC